MKYLKYTFIIVLLSIISCEEQPVIIPEMTVPVTDKVVLLEELTGVRCPNCPKGVATVEAIQAQFPGKVISYGIHGNQLTKPHDDSKYDFRYPDAIELEETLKPFFGKPAAAINRKLFDGEPFISSIAVDLWASFVEEELQKEQEVNIIIDVAYDESERSVDINVGVSTITNIPGDLNLHVSVTESHLIDPQDDINVTIPDFEHNHVLKEILTQLSGDNLGTDLNANDNVTRAYTYTIPDENNGEWIPDNMEVIVFVTSSDADGIVLQAGSAHIN